MSLKIKHLYSQREALDMPRKMLKTQEKKPSADHKFTQTEIDSNFGR